MGVMATIADTLRDLGTLSAAMAATVGFAALVAKLRPVRWVFRKLLADPLAGWFRGHLREEMDRKNGGSTLKDTVDRLDDQFFELTNKVDRLVALREAEHRQAEATTSTPTTGTE